MVRDALTGWAVPVRLDEASTGAEALERLAAGAYDCVLLDHRLPDTDGIELLVPVGLAGPACIVITGQGSEALAIAAMKRGAADYLDKDELASRTLWRAIIQAHGLAEARRAQFDAQTERQRLALHDPVSGLPNHGLFQSVLERTLAQAGREHPLVAVGKVALDHFKRVNDTYGHGAGDRALRIVGERLRHALRACDLAARLGGDEFALIIIDLQRPEELEPIAERLSAALCEPIDLDGGRIWIGASLGFCLCAELRADADRLLASADIALGRARNEGHNRTCWFTTEMDAAIRRRQRVHKTLPTALARREILVYYQPMVCLATGTVIGLEALVRWRHSDEGVLLPHEFLPVAREAGLLATLGAFVIDEVCAQIRAWLDRGVEIGRVSINLSPQQLCRADVVGRLRDALARWEVPAARLLVEVTEEVFLDRDRAVIAANLSGLSGLGVEVAIDDFGTGCASLAELRRRPFAWLKIDRSFVQDVDHDPDAAVIVGSVVKLASALGKRVIAEGVEARAQAERLGGLGVPAVQGFLFGRPMAARDAEVRLRRAPPGAPPQPNPPAGAA